MNRMNKMRGALEGHDSSGRPVRLGDRDSDGYVVGYIDGDGLSWESIWDRDRAVGSGRYLDALNLWRRGRRLRRPSALGFAVRNASRPSHVLPLRRECLDAADFWDRLRSEALLRR